MNTILMTAANLRAVLATFNGLDGAVVETSFARATVTATNKATPEVVLSANRCVGGWSVSYKGALLEAA